VAAGSNPGPFERIPFQRGGERRVTPGAEWGAEWGSDPGG
jgi:hypothetical protein